jgi:hypothetical protein
MWALVVEHAVVAAGLLLLPDRAAVALGVAWGLGVVPTVLWFRRGEARCRAGPAAAEPRRH